VRRINSLGASDAPTERLRGKLLGAASAVDCIDPAQPAVFFIVARRPPDTEPEQSWRATGRAHLLMLCRRNKHLG
jgi:hypothetical protein